MIVESGRIKRKMNGRSVRRKVMINWNVIDEINQGENSGNHKSQKYDVNEIFNWENQNRATSWREGRERFID